MGVAGVIFATEKKYLVLCINPEDMAVTTA